MLDNWLISEIDSSLNKIAEDRTVIGLIVRSSSERVFVAGADLAEIDALDDASLHAYLVRGARAFGRITSLPYTTVALVHASALGGGLELAMHCDCLVAVAPAAGAKPWKVGLPECGLGICPGWGGTQCLPARIDPGVALEATATGTVWNVDVVPGGLFDATCADIASAEEVVRDLILRRMSLELGAPNTPRSISTADRRELVRAALDASGANPWTATETGAAVVDAVIRGLRGGFLAGCEAEREHLVRLRHTPAARAKLDAFLKR